MKRTTLKKPDSACFCHQIEPHFLFNALNATIAGLVRENRNDDARRVWIEGLGGLPAPHPQDSHRLGVPLAEEMDFFTKLSGCVQKGAFRRPPSAFLWMYRRNCW